MTISDQASDPGLNARAAALQILSSALERRGGLDEALNQPAFLRLPVGERAFARALVMATLRNLGRIDRALEAKLRKTTPQTARQLMRIGVAQLFLMDTPDFAAVSTTVKLAERFPETQGLKGLINAVLRGLGRDGGLPTAPEINAPDWLLQRWRAGFGEADALAVAAAIP